MGGESTSKTSTDLLNSDVLRTVRAATQKTRGDLDSLLTTKMGEYTSADTSVVVFGSLAREEWTAKSDLDWTFLIDGSANSDHLQITQDIHGVFNDNGYIEPGPTGTFGNMAFSHDIIHQIGGQNDSNKNTTQRILLLLESVAIGKRTDAYERVINTLLTTSFSSIGR